MKRVVSKHFEAHHNTPKKRKLTSGHPKRKKLPLATADTSSSSSSSSSSSITATTTSFGVLAHPTIPPRVLILGSHPSTQSLQRSEYYGHRRNAFWWIAGDALGFRRGHPEGPSKEITPLHGKEAVIPYADQVDALLAAGYCLWDVVAECEREGSLDQNIKNAIPNKVREWVEANQASLERICFSTGASTADLFIKHNKEWLATGAFSFATDELTQRKFKRFVAKQQRQAGSGGGSGGGNIRLCVMPSVSPAYARMPYEEKRDGWFRECYGKSVGICV
jgi:TDG/mug DNA glycosylase family protein